MGSATEESDGARRVVAHVRGVAMFLFPESKAKTASRGREKFPSRNLFVTIRDFGILSA